MENRLCLDTDIISNILKDKNFDFNIPNKEKATIFTTIINLFEINCWETKKPINEFINNFKIINFSENDAKLAGDIYKKLKKEGQILDVRDILIGSICINNKILLQTNNKKHFKRLENFGLSLFSSQQ